VARAGYCLKTSLGISGIRRMHRMSWHPQAIIVTVGSSTKNSMRSCAHTTGHTNTTAKVIKSKGASYSEWIACPVALVFFCYLAFNRIRPWSGGRACSSTGRVPARQLRFTRGILGVLCWSRGQIAVACAETGGWRRSPGVGCSTQALSAWWWVLVLVI
jgi:hypothetical protein